MNEKDILRIGPEFEASWHNSVAKTSVGVITMPIPSALRLAAFAALCALFVSCRKPPENRPAPIPDVGANASESGWGNPEVEKGGIPGIDYARIDWYVWKDRLVLAVWLDRWEGGGSRGHNGVGSPGVYEGEFHASYTGFKDLADVDVHCKTTDGVTGPITINDEKFDLSQGSLLLVARSNGKLRTKLLNRHGLPSPDEKGDSKLFEKLKADPEVVSFFNPALAAAQDNKEPAPRSLADEAAYLTEKSGKEGWVAEDVQLTRDGGKEKHTGQLSIAFKARTGEPMGLVTLRWRASKMNGAIGDMGFGLIEKDGKRFIDVKDATGQEVVLRLEYSINKDVLTINGAVSKAWTDIFDDEPTKAVAFKPGKSGAEE